MRQTCGVTEANRVCEHITPEMKEAAKVASKTMLEIVLIRFLTDGRRGRLTAMPNHAPKCCLSQVRLTSKCVQTMRRLAVPKASCSGFCVRRSHMTMKKSSSRTASRCMRRVQLSRGSAVSKQETILMAISRFYRVPTFFPSS